jgi:hypothetical protein
MQFDLFIAFSLTFLTLAFSINYGLLAGLSKANVNNEIGFGSDLTNISGGIESIVVRFDLPLDTW